MVRTTVKRRGGGLLKGHAEQHKQERYVCVWVCMCAYMYVYVSIVMRSDETIRVYAHVQTNVSKWDSH